MLPITVGINLLIGFKIILATESIKPRSLLYWKGMMKLNKADTIIQNSKNTIAILNILANAIKRFAITNIFSSLCYR